MILDANTNRAKCPNGHEWLVNFAGTIGPTLCKQCNFEFEIPHGTITVDNVGFEHGQNWYCTVCEKMTPNNIAHYDNGDLVNCSICNCTKSVDCPMCGSDKYYIRSYDFDTDLGSSEERVCLTCGCAYGSGWGFDVEDDSEIDIDDI